MNFSQFWTLCKEQLKKELTSYQYQIWLGSLSIEENSDSWIIYAPTNFMINLVRDNCLNIINDIKDKLSPNSPDIELKLSINNIIKDKKNVAHNNIKNHSVNNNITKSDLNLKINKNHDKSNGYEYTRLKQDYTFENLVIGKGNQLASSAGLAISEALGKKDYNPFFIYGSTGLGKTHLAQAIANRAIKFNITNKIRYIHAEKYVNDYIKAVRRRDWDEFKRTYNSLDLLILDDIQFIAGKEKTMEEFFYLFNNFIDQNKQIILTSDKLPQKIEKLDNRLKSRFSCGLSVEIEPPEFEMRVAILHKKAEVDNFILPNDTAFFIAQSIESNVRDLEGALNRIRAHCKFTGKFPDIELTKSVLKDILAIGSKLITIEKIQKVVADYYNIKLSELNSKSRLRKIVRPRQIAMSLAKQLTRLSLPVIGDNFGGRDHTTVIHACRTINELRENDIELQDDYQTLVSILKN